MFNYGPSSGRKCCFIEIKLKKGSRAMDVSKYSRYKGEDEILLAPGILDYISESQYPEFNKSGGKTILSGKYTVLCEYKNSQDLNTKQKEKIKKPNVDLSSSQSSKSSKSPEPVNSPKIRRKYNKDIINKAEKYIKSYVEPEYKVGKFLGEGVSSIVFEGRRNKDGNRVAIKYFKKKGDVNCEYIVLNKLGELYGE
jgi:hypothetical protein